VLKTVVEPAAGGKFWGLDIFGKIPPLFFDISKQGGKFSRGTHVILVYYCFVLARRRRKKRAFCTRLKRFLAVFQREIDQKRYFVWDFSRSFECFLAVFQREIDQKRYFVWAFSRSFECFLAVFQREINQNGRARVSPPCGGPVCRLFGGALGRGGGNPKICLAGGENVYFRLSNGDFQREISCLRAQKDPIFACGGLEAMKCTKMGLDRAADEIFGVSGSESSLLWYIMIRWLP
jgi:hypothetical protein